jgi:hypothetical protein
MTRTTLKMFLLQALLRMDGKPMSEQSLTLVASQALEAPATMTLSVLRELEGAGLVSIDADDALGTKTYTLTVAGRHKAQQL